MYAYVSVYSPIIIITAIVLLIDKHNIKNQTE